MPSRKRGEGRGLEPFEVALIKGMQRSHHARDYIMSFLIHPGRVISPAALSEVANGSIGADIEPAPPAEVNAYIQQRLAEPQLGLGEQFIGPVSSVRVREVLRLREDAQATLPGIESHTTELKRDLPADKKSKGAISKTMAALANNAGGYVFLGVADDGVLAGIDEAKLPDVWEGLHSVIATHFAPFFRWDKAAVIVSGKPIAVIYVHAAEDKPVVCTGDYDGLIEGTIYYRYTGVTKAISAVDLFALLRARGAGEGKPKAAA